MYKRFVELDTNKNGQLDPNELFDVPEISDVKLKKKPFLKLKKERFYYYFLFIKPFYAILCCMENPLVKRVISIFDSNSDGKVSFVEFLVGITKLASSTDDFQKKKFAFDIYDINKDGMISNGELFTVMKMMVGNNLNDIQLQQLVDRTILQADKDGDGMISFEEFKDMISHMDVGNKLKLDL
ncbi:calcineurin B subunit isoform 1 [Plasmodium cynomolgi strain B]|uniref:Calcineurin B subunit isoform 1 n=1 Tax=Plasmodium cynomolgi (strain B) TaxID=1120755 RepID=K6UWN9_PLACD|nr:calcineurin B subunit isoform 1 [Plasmodium cynomolgi strain B]GAB68069.1 calcineurin B subunit isoform 1 [Plasmodium cynomolgi strain B]